MINDTWKRYTGYQSCTCGFNYKQWRVFIYCSNNNCTKFGKMISLHRINQPNVFSDFFKEHRGLPIEN